MKSNCPICNRINEFDREKLGIMIPCPSCKNVFVLKNSISPLNCPDCTEKVDPGLRICVNCGYSFDSGEKVKKHIPVYGEEFSLARRCLNDLVNFIPGLFKIHILFLFSASIAAALVIMYLGLFIMGLGAILTCIFFASCSLIVYAHGVGFLMTGEVQMLRNAMAELTGERWNFFLLMVFGPPITIFIIIYIIIGKLT